MIRTNLVSLYLSDNLVVNLVEIAAKYSLYCFKKMLCSDGEVAESSLLLCKFKEAYVASTCLVCSNYLKEMFGWPGVFLQRTADQII